MRHKDTPENPKFPGSDEDGCRRDRLDPAPCVLQGDGATRAMGDTAEAHPKAGGGYPPGGTGLCPRCQTPSPEGGGIHRGRGGIADGQPVPPGDPLGAFASGGGKCGLSKTAACTCARGLGTCAGAISTAQLGSGNLLSHGNLPARGGGGGGGGGVIKRLSPFPSRLRASPPCQGFPLAPRWHLAAAGLPFAHPAGHF